MPIITTSIDISLQNAISSNTANSFGNQTLYDMCNSGSMLNPNQLWDEIWLIGRSYAASPERRFVSRDGDITVGNGTGDYFKHIADYLVKNNNYNALCNILSALQPLAFNCSQNDFDNLVLSVQCVEDFNELIIEASKDYDRKYNPSITADYKNQISFCSKFLHFQVPDSIFIIDHYTKEGAKQLFSTQCQKFVKLCNIPIDNSVRFMFSNTIKSTFAAAKSNFTVSYSLRDYVTHVKRSYTLGCILKEIEQESAIMKGCNISYPRLTDIIFQSIV